MESKIHCTYPKPVFEFQPIMETQIKGAMAALNLMKAPGPNSTGNVVLKLKQCQSLLTPHLGPIFRATFSI